MSEPVTAPTAPNLATLLSGRPGVAVFGSSEPGPGDSLYEEARQAGRRLAAAGIAIINGGYGGVMEAASRGAREAEGLAIGVTVEQFMGRGGGNRWLSHEVREPDLYQRTRTLVEHAAGYLVLPGKAGTLAEVSFLWALRRAGLLGRRPVVLAGCVWDGLLATCKRTVLLDASSLEDTWSAASTDEAVTLLLERI